MRAQFHPYSRNAARMPAGAIKLLKRWRADRSGVTAIEFGLVALPFLMFMFGIIAVGLYFFITFSLENAVEQAARLVRTGQAQSNGMTTTEFKAEVCKKLPGFVDCAGKLRVNVQQFTGGFSTITTPDCVDSSGVLVGEGAATPVKGDAGAVVLVTACYEWELAKSMPFLKLGKMSNGSSMIRASTTFRTEPYE